ncbi:MAG: TraR/DksA C4-type zinc finger protein [Myxococcaceae bacterium]
MRTITEKAAQALARRRTVISSAEPLGDREATELVEIDAALDRINAGKYGRCENCGGAIGSQRLNALPETRYCIACAETAEKGR